MPRPSTSPDRGAYSGIQNGVRTVMRPSGQHSQNRSSDQKDQNPQGRNESHENISTSPKSNADFKGSTTTRVSYSQAATQGGSTRPMTSASTAARQGATPSLQTNGPPGLPRATPSTSTTQSARFKQPNSGTGSPMERNVSAANPVHRQVDRSPTEYQTNSNGSVANPIHRQPDTSPMGYHLNRNGSETNPAHRQPGTTYLPTENVLVKSDANTSRIHVEDAIEDTFSRLDLLDQEEIRFHNRMTQERTRLQRSLHGYLKFERKETCDAFKDLDAKMQSIAYERDELQKRMKIMQDEVKRMQQELHHARRIEQPDPVVVSTSAFTPHTADGVSGQDLIQDMERLNDEIYQFAALLAEQFEKTPGKRRTDLRQISPSDVAALQTHFGENIANFVLQARDRQEHSWLMHAVQSCIMRSCKSVLKSLLPFHKASRSLEDVYRIIRSREGQGMSGQWRSLVCRHGLDITRAERKISERITADVWQICDVLGWSANDPTHLESLKSITSRTLQLHRTIYVEILSGDIAIISPEHGTPFNPETMEVSEVSAGVKLPPVLCTTDMGLRKSTVEKVFSNEKFKFQEPKTVILKAKVFLDPSAAADDDSSWSDISRNNSQSS